MNELYDIVYEMLKKQVKEKSIFNPTVVKKVNDKLFPIIVVTAKDVPITNLGYFEQISLVTFVIEINAVDLVKNGNTYSSMQIASELHDIIEEYLSIKCCMEKTFDESTPNVDENVYRILMRFTKKYNKTRKILY